MLFWTIVFITYNLWLLFKSNTLKEVASVSGEYDIKIANAQTEEEKTELKKKQTIKALPIFWLLPLIIAEITYLINAIKIDTLKYPSIVMLFYIIVTPILFKQKKYDLTTEEGQMKYRSQIHKGKTLKSYLYNLVCLMYFGYMFYILTF